MGACGLLVFEFGGRLCAVFNFLVSIRRQYRHANLLKRHAQAVRSPRANFARVGLCGAIQGWEEKGSLKTICVGAGYQVATHSAAKIKSVIL